MYVQIYYPIVGFVFGIYMFLGLIALVNNIVIKERDVQ